MKLLIVLSVMACSYAAKLDRTYLPPASASSAGGSPATLNTPFGSVGQTGQSSRPSGFAPSDGSSYGQPAAPGFGQTSDAPKYGQNVKSAKTAGSNFYGQHASELNQPAQGSSSSFIRGNQEFSGPNAYTEQKYQPERARASLDRNGEILRYDSQNDGDTFAYSFETSNGISAEESGVATNGVQAQGGYSYTADDGQVISVAYTADENGYQPRGDHLPTPPPIPDKILKSIEENARSAAAGNQEGAYRPEENDSGFAPQQYTKGVSSYDQNQGFSGQTGISTYNRPQEQGLQQYGVPSAGIESSEGRPRSQGYNQPQNQYRPQNQNQGPSQLYGTPTAGAGRSSGRPLTGLQDLIQPQNKYQVQSRAQGPAQQYIPSNAGTPSVSRSSTGSLGFNQPKNQYQPQTQATAQQYGTPMDSALTGSPRSGSEGYNQRKPNQYYPGSSQPGLITPAGSEQGLSGPISLQGFLRSHNQDDSGYQYKEPQGSSQMVREYTQDRPSQAPGQSRLETSSSQQPGQSNLRTATQGTFPRPNETSGLGFGPASVPYSQGTLGGTRPSAQGQFQISQPTMPMFSMPEQSGYNYNRPGSQTPGGSRTQQPDSQQTGFSPNIFDQGRPGQAFGGPRQPPSFSSEDGYKY